MLGWGAGDAYLGTALGRAVYALVSASVTGGYLVLSRNRICPLGCCVALPCGRRRARADLLAPLSAEPGSASDGAEAAAGLCVVAALAIPSMLSMVAEWWAAEFRALIAGWIKVGEGGDGIATIMAANGVVFMLTVVYYQLPKGLGIAASVRCGNALGASDANGARQAAWLGLRLTGAVALLCALLYYAIASRFCLGVLAANADVVRIAAGVALPTAVCMVGFSLMMVSVQLLNACGRNVQGTWVCFLACWAVGISSGLVLGLGLGYGLPGIWYGNAMGLVVGAVVGVGAVARVDWEAESVAAVRRSASKAR